MVAVVLAVLAPSLSLLARLNVETVSLLVRPAVGLLTLIALAVQPRCTSSPLSMVQRRNAYQTVDLGTMPRSRAFVNCVIPPATPVQGHLSTNV